MVESSLVLIKPDGVKRRLIGQVIQRFEEKNLDIEEIHMLTISSELSDQHYAEHVDRPFYPGLKDFITSGPVVAMVITGESAISVIRSMVGETDAIQAAPGSIRGDFGLDKGENIIHASDSPASASREIRLYFPNR